MNPEANAFIYEFDRAAVESKDIPHFLNLYPRHRLPRGERLRDYYNTFVFSLDGYGSDPRELFTIPEVRRFYRHFYREWPLWMFACNLDAPNLLSMALCCVDTVHTINREGAPSVQLAYSRSEMEDFVELGFTTIDQVFARAGMTADEARRRRADVSDYFQRDWTAWQNLVV